MTAPDILFSLAIPVCLSCYPHQLRFLLLIASCTGYVFLLDDAAPNKVFGNTYQVAAGSVGPTVVPCTTVQDAE